MSQLTLETKKNWNTVFIFLAVLSSLTITSYYAILKLNPTSIYIGFLMLCPTLATFITLKIRKRSIFSLPWKIKNLRFIKVSYFIPIIYVSLAYTLIGLFGFGDFLNNERILKWSEELGIDSTNQTIVILLMIFLLLTVGVVKNLGATLGEEIGWRGFLIFELRKLMSFKKLSILSGFIWAIWHFPIINLIYGRRENLLLHMGSFVVMIIGMSIILAYLTFKSNSLLPAAIFHSVHNIYIQKICTPLTISNANTTYWIDEYGLMIPFITTLFAIYYWTKAAKENI